MFVTKLVSSQEKVFVDDDFSKFKKLDTLTALGGERVSFQIIYFDKGPDYLAVRPFCKVKVEGALSHCVTIRDVRWVPVDRPVTPGKTDGNYLRTTPGIYPDILTPLRYGGQLVIARDKLRSLWIDVDIPENFSGKCELAISIGLASASVGDTDSVEFNGAPIAEERVTLDVISASLPEQELLFTQWFYCDCLASYYNVEAWSEKHWEIVENFASLAVKRGRNVLYTPLLTPALNVIAPFERNPSQLVTVSRDNGKYSFDFSRVDRWVDMCDRIGVKYFEISHFFDQHQAEFSAKVYGNVDGKYGRIFGWETKALDPEYIRFLREMLSAFISHMKARGCDKRCFYHISDEPGLETLEHFLKIKEALSDILGEYTVMDALSNIEFYKSGAVSAPVPVTAHAMPFIEENVPGLWVYYACNEVVGYSNCYLSMPLWRTRSIGMQLYKYNVSGFLHWGYNYYNNRASGDAINPYLDLGGEDWVNAGDTFVVYPDMDGKPLESIRGMALEEAVQDVRAMRLAEKYYTHGEVVAAMEAALGDEITFTRCAHTADEMLRVREAVNSLIRRAVAGK